MFLKLESKLTTMLESNTTAMVRTTVALEELKDIIQERGINNGSDG